MGETFKQHGLLKSIPLFPLPNVVLFPRAVLPLHIFEQRYLQMTADALAGTRTIAMAFLKPGWEKNYYQRCVAIDPVVCVGEILTHELLPDGKYNFLLQGRTRARILRETESQTDEPWRAYRLADLQPIAETPVLEIDLTDERLRLERVLSRPAAAALPGGYQFLQMLQSAIPTADLADLLAFNVLDDVALKQSLLGEGDVRLRVRRVIDAVAALCPLSPHPLKNVHLN